LKHPCQKACLAAGIGCNAAGSTTQFEQHPRLGQRKGAVRQGFVEQPDQAGIKPVEASEIADQGTAIGWHVMRLP